jgi:hypothetical protein
LKLLQSAMRLSANQLTKDRNQLTPHLLGRLSAHDSSNIQNLLKKAIANQKWIWLRPLTASLTSAEGPLVRTLEGHSDSVNSVALTPDGKLAISASHDNTLKVWDLTSGQELRTLKGHSHFVRSVAITPDGKLVLSASIDKTLDYAEQGGLSVAGVWKAVANVFADAGMKDLYDDLKKANEVRNRHVTHSEAPLDDPEKAMEVTGDWVRCINRMVKMMR